MESRFESMSTILYDHLRSFRYILCQYISMHPYRHKLVIYVYQVRQFHIYADLYRKSSIFVAFDRRCLSHAGVNDLDNG